MGIDSGSDSTLPATNWVVADAQADFGFVPVKITYWQKASTFAPHGSIQYCGSDGETERRYVWLEAGESVQFICHLAADSAFVTVALDLWTPTGIASGIASFANTITTTPTTIACVAPDAGYYALSYKMAPAATPAPKNLRTVQVTEQVNTVPTILYIDSIKHIAATNSPVWCHLPASDYPASQGRMHTPRIHGVSLMYSNTSATNFSGGQISMAQLPSGTDWISYALNPTSIENAQGSLTLNAKKGMYGFLKQTQPSDSDFLDNVRVDNDQHVIDTFYSLDEKSAYLGMSIFISDIDGRSGYFTHAISFEYATLDKNSGVEEPDKNLSPQVFKDAQAEVKSMVQFHENPTHFMQLLRQAGRLAKKAAEAVVTYGPTVMKAGKFIASVL
jgi:hypothetical protein